MFRDDPKLTPISKLLTTLYHLMKKLYVAFLVSNIQKGRKKKLAIWACYGLAEVCVCVFDGFWSGQMCVCVFNWVCLLNVFVN
jgi:hypothetical protein